MLRLDAARVGAFVDFRFDGAQRVQAAHFEDPANLPRWRPEDQRAVPRERMPRPREGAHAGGIDEPCLAQVNNQPVRLAGRHLA
jgi:hypothetical protein